MHTGYLEVRKLSGVYTIPVTGDIATGIGQLGDHIRTLESQLNTAKKALSIKDRHDQFDCTAERATLELTNQKLRTALSEHCSCLAPGHTCGTCQVLKLPTLFVTS